MTRRKLVALVSVCVLFVIGLVVFSAGLFLTHTDAGRERMRAIAIPLIQNAIKGGTIYVGHIGGSIIGGLTIDSIAIRDKRGDLFVSTGPVSVSYNWRDIVDQRIYITKAQIEHPYVHIVQHETGIWNFKEIFASAKPSTPQVKTTNTRSLGDYIVIDSATAHNGTFILSMPWHVDDTLHGARRDSVIRAHVGNADKSVEKTFEGYSRTYAWRNGNGLISHIRLADPDSDKKFGQQFNVASLTVDEFVPTFKFHNVKAEARHLGDSVWFDVAHFDMPASTGTGTGKVWWGSDLPVRYDIAIKGDSVSLDDVNWVYPTLPRTGGGKLDLGIKNDPKNLQIVDFQLKNMDVRSEKSHLTGDMWFGVGAPILLVRNVNMRADPVNFDLLRTLAGKPFPYDWQGDLNGTVKARGGPLTHFYIDDAQATFADAHVPGAVSRFSGKGELDILVPANTTFHGFAVDVGALDLRTPRFLFPGFPPLGGFIAGTATLDSSYLDVRFSDANITHQDGAGDPSHITGSGRVTDEGKFLAYDVNLNAEPLSLTMIARSYPALPPNLGLWSGPIAAQGTSPDLTLKLALQGSNGALSYDGHADIDSVGGMGATGHGEFSALNLGALLALPHPNGTLSGRYDVDVAGETAATLHGSAGINIERTMLDSIRVYPSYAHVRFADGQMKIDSASIHTDAARIVASGGIGLPKGSPDSLHLHASIDSLGGLRAFILPRDTTIALDVAAIPDSLAGDFTLDADAIGTLDALHLRGKLESNSQVMYKTESARSVHADFNLANALSSPAGSIELAVDSAVVASVWLDSVKTHVEFRDKAHLGFVVDAHSHNGPRARTIGAWSDERGAQTIALDSLSLDIIDDRWRLANRPQLVIDSAGMRLDSLVLHNADSAVVAMSGRVPSAGAAVAQLRASGLPLRDFGTLAQLPDTLYGTAGITVNVSGAKSNPSLDAHAAFSAVRYRDVDFESAAIDVNHRDGRLLTRMNALQHGDTVISGQASLPLQLSLFAAKVSRKDDSIGVSLKTGATDLSILKLFVPSASLPVVTGRLTAGVTATGTWARPVFSGSLVMLNGTAQVPALGNVTFTDIDGTVLGHLNAQRQDSVEVHATARTLERGNASRNAVSIDGYVKNVERLQAPNSDAAFSFTIKADSLHTFNKRTVADLYISTPTNAPVVISGTVAAPVLTGTINVDRGSIFLADADLARKLIVDTTDLAADLTQERSSLVTRIKNNLQVQNASVTLGNDVRLSSAEANVRLAGKLDAVNAASGRIVQSSIPLPFTLVGQLQTTGGTYNLNLLLVQREFQVLPEGTVTFDGGPVDRPALDVRAQYNVKQARDRDLNVIVSLTGRLPTPTIALSSSNADYAISQSDLVSYLVTGSPGFDFTSGQQQTILSVLSPTVSAVAAQGLRSTAVGGFFDALQFQLGAGNGEPQGGLLTQKTLGQYFTTSTVEAGKRITSDLYISLNTGFCQIQARGLPVGAKAEYRFNPKISFQAGYDPPTAQQCFAGQSSFIGFVPTPSQWSLSLLHSWRF